MLYGRVWKVFYFISIFIFKQVLFTEMLRFNQQIRGVQGVENIASSKILFVSICSNTDSVQWACAFSRRIPWKTFNCCGRNAFFSLKLRETDWNMNEFVWASDYQNDWNLSSHNDKTGQTATTHTNT